MSNVPILLITYRRESETRQVIEALRKEKVKSLYFWANSPNSENHLDEEYCEAVRELVNEIDWDCDVITNFQLTHLSARVSIVSAIDWFFSNVEAGIILEDDCVPCSDFFRFTEQTLTRYRDDQQVMHISGTNHAISKPDGGESYYFSNYSHNWGWATWASAWSKFRPPSQLMNRSAIRENAERLFEENAEQTFWLCIFDLVESGNLDTWDYYWMFTIWLENGLCITPAENLVSNIGFGEQATNTTGSESPFANQVTGIIPETLIHPAKSKVMRHLDKETADSFYKISKSYRLRHLKIRLSAIFSVSTKRRIKQFFRI